MICKQNLIFLVGCLLIFFQSGCKDEILNSGDTISNSKVMVLGHAGMGIAFNKPINSFESIETALYIGCDGSEMDIQMTLDSIIVVYHDLELSTQTNCINRISESYWKDIQDCKYRNGIHLLTLEELFNRTKNLQDFYFSLDCKQEIGSGNLDAYQFRLLRAIERICSKYQMSSHVFLEGPVDFLKKAQTLGLENYLFLLSDNISNAINVAAFEGFFGITTNATISAVEMVNANNQGLKVMAYDVKNYYENKALLLKKPDIIQTDDPISLLKLLQRFNYENVTP